LEKKDRYGEEKSKYIKGICGDSTDVEALRDCIFEGEIDGKQLPIYRRDIFHDAYFSKSNAKGLFLGTDYITPHKDNPLKNPQPIKFLKILPEVEITFRFELRDEIIKAMDKFKLFRQILLDFGVGAKTNVGYGQLRRTHRHFKITQAEFRCRRQDQCRVRAVKGS
jgi:CRISPR-associated protein Cmr6